MNAIDHLASSSDGRPLRFEAIATQPHADPPPPISQRRDRADSIAVSIVSNSRLLREGLAAVICPHFAVCLVGHYAGDAEPDFNMPNPAAHVVLIDGGIGEACASAWTRWWHGRETPPAILILELEDNTDVILACIEAGAIGYTLREAAPVDVARAIERASKGQAVCSPEVTAHLCARLAALRATEGQMVASQVPLTAREEEVLRCIAAGYSNKEISAALNIQVHTVKHHVHNILEKLKMSHRRDAARYAVGAGWVQPSPATVSPRVSL
jgi:DNA-binding NarL/FixJ family response regulator